MQLYIHSVLKSTKKCKKILICIFSKKENLPKFFNLIRQCLNYHKGKKKLNGVVLIKKFQVYFYFNISALYIVYLNKVSYRSASVFFRQEKMPKIYWYNNFRQYSLEYEQNFHQFFCQNYITQTWQETTESSKKLYLIFIILWNRLHTTSRNVIIGMFSRLQMCNFLNSSCSKAKCQFGNLALNIQYISLSCF